MCLGLRDPFNLKMSDNVLELVQDRDAVATEIIHGPSNGTNINDLESDLEGYRNYLKLPKSNNHIS